MIYHRNSFLQNKQPEASYNKEIVSIFFDLLRIKHL